MFPGRFRDEGFQREAIRVSSPNGFRPQCSVLPAGLSLWAGSSVLLRCQGEPCGFPRRKPSIRFNVILSWIGRFLTAAAGLECRQSRGGRGRVPPKHKLRPRPWPSLPPCACATRAVTSNQSRIRTGGMAELILTSWVAHESPEQGPWCIGGPDGKTSGLSPTVTAAIANASSH